MPNMWLGVAIFLAHPLSKHLAETTKGDRSTRSLLHYIFMRCAYAGVLGVVASTIASTITDAIVYEFYDQLEVINDFAELCRKKVIRCLAGKRRIRGKVDCEIPLPEEVWGLIGKRLTSRLDIVRFRSVCKGWRSSLPRPTRFPLSVPPPPNCDPNMPCFITQVTLYRCRGRHMAVAFEEVDRDSKFRGCYVHPWKLKCDLPMTSFTGYYPNHQGSKISSYLSTGYRLRMGLPRFDSRVEGQWNLQDNKFVNKTVLIYSKRHDEGVNPSYARASDLSVVAHLSFGGMEGRLALLRLGGGSPESWHWDTDFCTQAFKAMGTYKGQLCTLDQWGRVFFMDYDSLQMTQVGDPLSFIPEPDLSVVRLLGEMERKHLYESHGELFAYDEVHFKRTRRAQVYKLSLRHNKWVKHSQDMGMCIADLLPYYM